MQATTRKKTILYSGWSKESIGLTTVIFFLKTLIGTVKCFKSNFQGELKIRNFTDWILELSNVKTEKYITILGKPRKTKKNMKFLENPH